MSMIAAATLAATPGSAEKKARGKASPASAASALGASTKVTVAGVREPSGVAWHPGRQHLFVVGDDGTLAEIDEDGGAVHLAAVAGNLEDVAVHTPSGLVVLLSENTSELIVWDAASRRETARVRLDSAALLGEAPGAKNQGFEGLAFRPDAGRPGGGSFLLAHQRSPAAIVAVSFDPARPPSNVGREAVLGRWPSVGFEDLTAITLAGQDRFLVIAEAADRLLVVRGDGGVERQIALPGAQQEGVCLDGRGRLWIADDRAGHLLRFDERFDAPSVAPAGN